MPRETPENPGFPRNLGARNPAFFRGAFGAAEIRENLVLPSACPGFPAENQIIPSACPDSQAENLILPSACQGFRPKT